MIYEWIEHPFLWAVRIRPAELFDQATVGTFPSWEEWDDPDVDGQPEGALTAVHVLTRKPERYIKFYDKRHFSRRWVAEWHEDEPEREHRDAHQLAKLPPERWAEVHGDPRAS